MEFGGNFRLSLILGSLFLLVGLVHGQDDDMPGCKEPLNGTFPLGDGKSIAEFDVVNKWCNETSKTEANVNFTSKEVKKVWIDQFVESCLTGHQRRIETIKNSKVASWEGKLTLTPLNRDSICKSDVQGTNATVSVPLSVADTPKNDSATQSTTTTTTTTALPAESANSTTETVTVTTPGSTETGNAPAPAANDEADGGSSLYWIVPLTIILSLILALSAGYLIHRYTKSKGYQNSVKTPAGDLPVKNEGSNV